MTFDIVVTVDRTEEIDALINSLISTGRATDINLALVCKDGAIPTNVDRINLDFAGVNIVESGEDYGVRKNIGAAIGSDEYIIFFSDSIEVYPDFFNCLEKNINMYDKDIAAFECRMLPYETGQYFNPVTLQTEIADFRAVVARRNVFASCGGFDKKFTGKLCDADICFRITGKGYKIVYMPDCNVNIAGEDSSMSKKYIDSVCGLLLLKYKYSSIKEIINGYKVFFSSVKNPVHFDNVRKMLLKGFVKQLKYIPGAFCFRFIQHEVFKNSISNLDKVFSLVRLSHEQVMLDNDIKVSVVVRTFNRSKFIVRALKSLENQTYKNIEILVCEDGIEMSRDVVFSKFSHLNIKYLCDGVKKGRSRNGNLGLAAATGEWCFFLDDDDYLYPEHVECMLSQTIKYPKAEVILGSAVAAFYDNSNDELIRLEPMVFDRIDIFTMCQKSRIPIQTGMFKRELFLRCGGLEEKLDAHEDWAMWLKFYKNAKFSGNNSADIKRITSVFVQDSDEAVMQQREKNYAKYNEAFINDKNLNFNITLAELRRYYTDVLRDVEHLYNNNKLSEFLEEKNN